MESRVRINDKLRFVGDFDGQNFIDVSTHGRDDLCVDMFPSFHYIEIRKKEGQIRIYAWKRKSDKRYTDLGWWDDAEVIFALNETKGELL